MKIAIIGGGIAGLSLAYYLSKKPGNKVVLYEKNAAVGGLLGILTINNVGFEGYYHHLFKGDQAVIGLARELGLADKLLFLPSRVAVFFGGKIYPFSSPFDLLQFNPLPFVDRLRVALTILYLRYFISWQNWRQYRTVSAASWLQRVSGRAAYEIVWRPLLYGKFGEFAPKVSLAWLWHRFYIRSQSRSKTAVSEELVYFKGGFKVLVEALTQAIKKNQGEIILKTTLSRVRKQGKRLVVVSDKGTAVFDKVVFATPLPVLDKIVPELPQSYVKKLARINYRAAFCLVLDLKQQLLDKIYWLNIHDLKMPFLSVVEHTNFVDPKIYGGKNLVYVGNYLSWQDPLLKLSPEKLLELVAGELKKINPGFKKTWVRRFWLFKDLYAQPVVTTDYYRLIPPVKTPVPGVYLLTMAQIYPEDRGTNQAVRDAKKLAQML